MSNAFEITPDDVYIVALCMGKKIDEDKCEEIHDELDHELVEHEALKALDMEQQTEAAYQEIERQIREDNLL